MHVEPSLEITWPIRTIAAPPRLTRGPESFKIDDCDEAPTDMGSTPWGRTTQDARQETTQWLTGQR